ncbi:MAG: lysophospholipid acyltransferase family protein [Minicystis sp.]
MTSDRLKQLWDDLRRHDSHVWRRAVDAGVTHGPDALVRYSPPVFGVAFAAALARQRRAVRDNLRRALGPRPALHELRDVAAVFANYASSLTDAFVAGSERGDPLRVRCHDERPIEDALRDGRGMILATAHTGGWQVAGLQLQSLHGVDLVVVMRPERDARAQEITDRKRARAGVKIAHLGEDPLAVLSLLGHLRKGGVVAMQMDRLPQGMRGRKSELFGEPFFVPEGPLRLAAASGAPIVPVFTRRLGYMEYDVRVAPPVRLPRKPTTADLDHAARAVLREMEEFVRENPTQWFHFE